MRDKVLVFNWKERERLQTQLEGVPHLGEVVKAILLLDRSLTQTVGPD